MRLSEVICLARDTVYVGKKPRSSGLSTKDFYLPRSTEKVHDRSDDYNNVVAHVSTIGSNLLSNGTDELKSRIHG